MLTPQARSDATLQSHAVMSQLFNTPINQHYLMALVALYLTLSANIGFFKQVLSVYPIADNPGFILSIAGLLFGLLWLLLQLLCYRFTIKGVLVFMVLVAAVCGYFTNAYGTIFDTNMLVNSLETDHAEARDLLSLGFLAHLVLLGVLPAFFIAKLPIKRLPLKRAVLQKLLSLLLIFVLIAGCLLPFGDQYASFFRQHKQVRYYANPLTPIYSTFKLGADLVAAARRPDSLIEHATDAKRSVPAMSANASPLVAKPKLLVFVVGETVRADHIGLNGYARNTTPLLAKLPDVYSFKDVTSCGTSTAYSVPCMFSYAGRENYDMQEASYHENVLDTLHKQGVKVIWRDNNSSSKGVADRVIFEDFKTAATNPVCDEECRDIGMLTGFDKLVTAPDSATTTAQPQVDATPKQGQDTLIVLHQMGNHGPAYYKRYPKEFEVFKPVCTSSELSKCDRQAVINGFDNALVYTDYFLNAVIDTLKPYTANYDVAMLYVSDHGESLGENNIYLHGLPYKIAPQAQKQVPAILWLPPSNQTAGAIDAQKMSSQLNTPVSHDYITPTLLEFFGITTSEVANKPTFFHPM